MGTATSVKSCVYTLVSDDPVSRFTVRLPLQYCDPKFVFKDNVERDQKQGREVLCPTITYFLQ